MEVHWWGREHGQGGHQIAMKRWWDIYNDESLDYKKSLAYVEAKTVAGKMAWKNSW